jgi:hypothetical protein
MMMVALSFMVADNGLQLTEGRIFKQLGCAPFG